MSEEGHRSKSWLGILGGSLGLLFVAIDVVWLNPRWLGLATPPILAVTLLYLAAGLVWLFALRACVRAIDSRRLVVLIVVLGTSFRFVQLCAPPILEVDYYRYMWDGIVSSHGASPYGYSPNEVLEAELVVEDGRLRRLVDIASLSESHHTILTKVHFPDYTTIYPPVSQLVFALTMAVVPDQSGLEVHRFAMRLTLVLFDLATLTCVLALIRTTGLHRGWLAAYAWNPLVIKEIANSGHLDSIAAFFVATAVLIVVRALRGRGTSWTPVFASLLLALGTGAKLFPLILTPLFACGLSRVSRRDAWIFALSYPLFTVGCLGWMAMENQFVAASFGRKQPATVETHARESANSREGLSSFLVSWRINTGVFGLVYENGKPDVQRRTNQAWCVAVPNRWREAYSVFAKDRIGLKRPAFVLARATTLSIFAAIYLAVLWSFYCSAEPMIRFPTAVFFVLATFFLMQPTVNPWYWVWSAPFLCFVKNRGWLAISVLLFCYYLRFWCKFSAVELQFFAHQYEGVGVFDHVIVWCEHLGFLIVLVVGRLLVHQAPVSLSSKTEAD